jgi:prepilin-type N-terminal cleavage/methylation domain-containing protein
MQNCEGNVGWSCGAKNIRITFLQTLACIRQGYGLSQSNPPQWSIIFDFLAAFVRWSLELAPQYIPLLRPLPRRFPKRPRTAKARAALTGFTLVELLVVIAIVGVLVALLLPAVQAARESARRSQCSSQLKQLGVALHNYHDVNKVFPPRRGGSATGVTSFWGNADRRSAFVALLPFIEQQPLFDKIEAGGFADTSGNVFGPGGPVAWYARS